MSRKTWWRNRSYQSRIVLGNSRKITRLSDIVMIWGPELLNGSLTTRPWYHWTLPHMMVMIVLMVCIAADVSVGTAWNPRNFRNTRRTSSCHFIASTLTVALNRWVLWASDVEAGLLCWRQCPTTAAHSVYRSRHCEAPSWRNPSLLQMGLHLNFCFFLSSFHRHKGHNGVSCATATGHDHWLFWLKWSNISACEWPVAVWGEWSIVPRISLCSKPSLIWINRGMSSGLSDNSD
jgi:hypothetical protein